MPELQTEGPMGPNPFNYCARPQLLRKNTSSTESLSDLLLALGPVHFPVSTIKMMTAN